MVGRSLTTFRNQLKFAPLLIFLVACGDVQQFDSRLDSVFPEAIPSYGETTVTLSGLFVSPVVVSVKTGSAVENTDFKIRLEGVDENTKSVTVDLEDISYRDEHTLQATIPGGIAGGDYRVVVIDPRGHEAQGSVVVSVVPGTPDHTVFVPDTMQWLSVDDQLTLNVAVVTAEGLWYPISARVTFLVKSTEIEIVETSLANATEPEETECGMEEACGPTVSGDLDENGEGSITIACKDESTCASIGVFEVEVGSPPEWTKFPIAGTVEVTPIEPYNELQVDFSGAPSYSHTHVVTAGSPFPISIKAMAKGVNNKDVVANVRGALLLFDADGYEVGYLPGFESPTAENLAGCVTDTPLMLENGVWNGSLVCYQTTGTNWLLAIGPSEKHGKSDDFSVVSADPEEVKVEIDASGFRHSLTGPSITAGTSFSVSLTPVDAFGNPVDIVPDAITLRDNVGALQCNNWDVSSLTFDECSLTMAQDSDAVSALISFRDGPNPVQIQGVSQVFDVVAGAASKITFAEVGPELVAGEAVSIPVWLADYYDNPVGYGNGSVQIVDSPTDQALTPELSGNEVSVWLKNGMGTLAVSLERAVGQTRFVATFGDFEGQSGFFAVRANIATTLVVLVGEAEVVAGGMGTAALFAEDLYGNIDTRFEGSRELLISPIKTVLQSEQNVEATFVAGESAITFSPIAASREAQLKVEDSIGGIWGESAVFVVVASPELASYQIVDPMAAHWSERAFKLTLLARDAFGNFIEDYSGQASVADRSGTLASLDDNGGLPHNVLPIVDGQYTGNFVISDVMATDRLTISDGQVVTQGVIFPVYSLDCEVFPDTFMTLNGHPDYAVACENDSIGFKAWATSELGILDYVWTFGDGVVKRGAHLTDTQYSYAFTDHYIAAISAVDYRYCASWVEADVYVGVNDGSPTGPMTMDILSGSEPLTAGADDGSQVARIRLQAYDCREDYAGSGDREDQTQEFEVTVLAGMGQLESNDASSDRQGLQFKLAKVNGSVDFNFSVGKEDHAGTARIVAAYERTMDDGREVALAEGMVDIDVKNDRSPPYVTDFSPSGYVSYDVDQITVDFNEPIRADNIVDASDSIVDGSEPAPSLIRVSATYPDSGGAYRPLAVQGYSLENANRRLIITLLEPLRLSAMSAQVEVVLSSGRGVPSITDIDGNLLDGDWNGTITKDAETGAWLDPFEFRFGNWDVYPFTLGSVECGVSEPVFSPDGQNSAGEESDFTDFLGEVYVKTGLRAYGVEVVDPHVTGPVALLWSTVDNASGRTEIWKQWDGRGLNGQILANGVYPFTLTLIDSYDNWMEMACFGTVEIDNPVDLGAYP